MYTSYSKTDYRPISGNNQYGNKNFFPEYTKKCIHLKEGMGDRMKPFGIKDKIGYMFGDFGNDFTFILSSSFLMKFYTDVMGVDGFVVGIVMMIARFVDAFTDITMGRICDKSKTLPAGKFKPWLLRMSGPSAIASFLIYQSSFADWPMAYKILWLFVTYILWGSVFYTAINIPYGSMASAISAEPGDRQSLSTYRTMGGTLAGLVIGAGVPMLAYDDVNGNMVLNGPRFTMIAGVFSVLSVICYLICYALVTERVRSESYEAEAAQNGVFEMLKNAVKNKALISMIAASIVMLLAQLTMQSMANYVYPNFYRSTAAQSASNIIMLVSMLIAASVARPVAEKIGKAELSAIANAFAAGICILLFFLRPENVWVYVLLMALCWLGLGMFSMVSWALITDVIDYSEVVNGVREDGSVYALYSFARKLGQAAAAGVSGWLLTMIGYTQETAFDTEVVNGVFNISTLIPAIGFGLLAAILWFWYPLHKGLVDKNVAILKEKHGK